MLIKRIKLTIKRYSLISKNEKIIIGVSGGPDSISLLYALNSIKNEFDIRLHVAHLDHRIRQDSYKDALYVKKICEKLSIPCTIKAIDVKPLAKDGSLEQAAREARLKFLFQTARKNGAKKIALGHTIDDQAETVLMRLLRGAGLYGLSGMAPKRKFSGFMIIRPLIETRRREIEAFVKKTRLKPVTDSTNTDEAYLRNKVRRKLIPLLGREYNNNIVEVLNSLAETSSLDYDYLRSKALKIYKRLGKTVNLKKFGKIHPSIQRLIFRMHIERLKGSTRRINFKHIKEIEDLIANRPVNSIVNLPQGISVVKRAKTLFFRAG